VLTAQRRYDEAENLYVRSRRGLERSPESPAAELANTLEQFAQFLRLRSNEQAQTMEARAKAIRRIQGYTVDADSLKR
jgi:hypothetical protein